MTTQNKNCSFHLFNSSAKKKLKKYNSSKSKKLMPLKRLGNVLLEGWKVRLGSNDYCNFDESFKP